MRHHGRGHGHGYGRGMGRGRSDFDDFGDFGGPPPGIGRMMHGFGGFGYGGPRFERPSTRERIESLEETQRDLEEMTADIASHLAWLRQRETEQAAT